MKFLDKLPKKWLASCLLAGGAHFFIFFGSGLAFVQQAQYGVDASTGGIEVSLIAAMPETAVKSAVKAKEENKPEEAEEKIQEEHQAPVQKTKPEKDKKQKDYTFTNDTPFTGDGSSEIPGQSRTTFYSPGGSTTDKAGYLSNPPPPYPAEALQKGQEGLVVLIVNVDTAGRPRSVTVKQKSGYRILDDTAVKTVKKWKFEPAHIGMMNVESELEIPIRFVLKDELERRAGY